MDKQMIHILLVEDEDAHVELVGRAFESHTDQVRLTVAGSLQEARICLTESQPNLVIADLVLPDGRGTELLPAVDEECRFPLMVMTSHGDEQVAVEAMKAGALDYVVKSAITLADMPHIAERALREWNHIVEHKWAEECQKVAKTVLELLNKPAEKVNIIHDILLLIKEFSSVEAAGIRLKEGEDFPYYEISGFPVHFVEAERYLCERDQAGEVIRDSEGNPILECMCGDVICGRTNPSFPFFTEGGSFWTNSTTEFLAPTTEEDRQTWTRNRCNSEGYESLALIPLRSDSEVIGLLQLNDTRRDMFTFEMIRFLEGIGASIGIALARKQTEEQIKTSLQEKEVLLKEIHHRVKNNMQVIVSLLNLQRRYIKDEKYGEMFRESQNRIRSMALIHEKLYQSENLTNIDFAEYIRSLASTLFQTYEAYGKIALKMNIEDISLSIDSAIPCGLILNELVSNSLKYAFPEGKEGEIKIILRSADENEIELIVSDNGVGIPEDVDIKNTESLGLQLVATLTENQLDGEMQLNRTEGTEFRIKFKGKD
ncbi:MAG: histidine kinase dimerization/phosphoacceptor domain -containing protein [Candidatus Poribacteria bacterium]